MTPALVLWDIDGTLLRSGRATTLAFNQALQEVYELSGAPARIDYGGKTDSQIALEVLALHELEEAAALERLPHFHTRYTELAHQAYDELVAGIEVLPGVRQVIAALRRENVVQSLLTGNLLATAQLKLRAAGLLDLLEVEIGAFGSDHRDRDELVPIARAKAEERFGPLWQVIVVGDTPRDIACGKAGGARTVAVATGHWSADALREYAPDALLLNLVDTRRSIAAILDLDA